MPKLCRSRRTRTGQHGWTDSLRYMLRCCMLLVFPTWILGAALTRLSPLVSAAVLASMLISAGMRGFRRNAAAWALPPRMSLRRWSRLLPRSCCGRRARDPAHLRGFRRQYQLGCSDQLGWPAMDGLAVACWPTFYTTKLRFADQSVVPPPSQCSRGCSQQLGWKSWSQHFRQPGRRTSRCSSTRPCRRSSESPSNGRRGWCS
mmetsp:Transcript_33910/g.59832  ORF Transcript_33910/g.59832 Transcript_33910/m.59832 type:complete len:203 (-) Transcript_33910:1271-1879(-)